MDKAELKVTMISMSRSLCQGGMFELVKAVQFLKIGGWGKTVQNSGEGGGDNDHSEFRGEGDGWNIGYTEFGGGVVQKKKKIKVGIGRGGGGVVQNSVSPIQFF